MFSDVSSSRCPFFGVPEFDNCGGCFVTLEAYTCRVYFSPAVELTLLYRRNWKCWILAFKRAQTPEDMLDRWLCTCVVVVNSLQILSFHFLQIMWVIYKKLCFSISDLEVYG